MLPVAETAADDVEVVVGLNAIDILLVVEPASCCSMAGQLCHKSSTLM